MHSDARIYVAGHRGLVGSALVRALQAQGFSNLVWADSQTLDLRDAHATEAFFAAQRPEYVVLAAARVGGIAANLHEPVAFLHDNLAIQNHVLSAAHRHGVKRLVFLGSSCIYPREAAQPLREAALLTGPLEPTNRPYALAKIAGIELLWSYNRQYGTQFTALMPCNLYGPNDCYDPQRSHVIPGMMYRLHSARQQGAASVTLWGSGRPRREFMHSDDLAQACLHILQLDDARFAALRGSDRPATDAFEPPLINIGTGIDIELRELAEQLAAIIGFQGAVLWDTGQPDGTPRKCLDVSRIHALGWRARISLNDGLRAAYADFLNQRT